MALRLRLLRYFVAVAEEGQFTLAAAKLHVSQPSLSQAISSLEAELSLELLERHARGVRLTRDGEIFLEKARAALEAAEDAQLTARSLARVDQHEIAFGYLGLPPNLTNPDLIVAFTRSHPESEIMPRELSFPTLPTASWLRPVDVAICTRPTADPNVSFQPLSVEPRVVLAPKDHPLAGKRELAVEEVLDETFIGFDRSIDPAWAGFWSLDDHRGEPPRRIVSGQVVTAQQRFAMLAAGRGIATVPALHAAAIANVLQGVAVIPLSDAEPAILTLVARKEGQSKLVKELFATARELAHESPHIQAVDT